MKCIHIQGKYLTYVGGLATLPKGRKLGYGAILGLGSTAFLGVMEYAEGITFAQSDNGGASLFQKLGGYLLSEKLTTPSYCNQHQCNVQLLGISENKVPIKTEKRLKELKSHLQNEVLVLTSY